MVRELPYSAILGSAPRHPRMHVWKVHEATQLKHAGQQAKHPIDQWVRSRCDAAKRSKHNSITQSSLQPARRVPVHAWQKHKLAVCSLSSIKNIITRDLDHAGVQACSIQQEDTYSPSSGIQPATCLLLRPSPWHTVAPSSCCTSRLSCVPRVALVLVNTNLEGTS